MAKVCKTRERVSYKLVMSMAAVYPVDFVCMLSDTVYISIHCRIITEDHIVMVAYVYTVLYVSEVNLIHSNLHIQS